MEADTTPPVDLEGFRETMRAAGIEEIVEPTLEIFLQEAQRLFAALSTAVPAGDEETVRSAAHSLKSSAGNIWATRLARVLNELEGAANRGETLR